MAEGAPLLREYRVYSSIEGSNPSFSAIKKAAHRAAFLMAETDGNSRIFRFDTCPEQNRTAEGGPEGVSLEGQPRHG